jgi:hypothetical protein
MPMVRTSSMVVSAIFRTTINFKDYRTVAFPGELS